MCGSATLTTVASSTTISCAVAMTSSATPSRRPPLRSRVLSVAESVVVAIHVMLAAQHRPDIALVDIQMPVLDGLGATRQIVADDRLASVRVVILTNCGLDEYIF